MDTNVQGVAALAMCATPDTNPVAVGCNVTYTITINNQGTAGDTNLVLKTTLPDELQYVSSDGPSKANVSGQTISFDAIPSLGPGEHATFKVTAKAVKANDVRFNAALSSDSLKAGPIESRQGTRIFEKGCCETK